MLARSAVCAFIRRAFSSSRSSLQMFGASRQLASMLFAPIALILISVGYATQYPIYRSLIETAE